ncbi:hypothetical protein ACJJTC_000889 [Scirpophaga incertulas]
MVVAKSSTFKKTVLSRSSVPVTSHTSVIVEPQARSALLPPPSDPVQPQPIVAHPKAAESYKPPEDANHLLQKHAYLPQLNPIPLSPKISPSSIPNPNPSVATAKQAEPNYNSYLYSVPGYSAFQPVAYPGAKQVNPGTTLEFKQNHEFVQNPQVTSQESVTEEKRPETKMTPESQQRQVDLPKNQPSFEKINSPDIIPTRLSLESGKKSECMMSITSLTQGSGATVTIPSQFDAHVPKLNTPDRFPLNTTNVTGNKVEVKSVSNHRCETVTSNSMLKKLPNGQVYYNQNNEITPKIEIQSNIVIKNAQVEARKTDKIKQNTNISSLINAAETINKTDTNFKIPEPKSDVYSGFNDTSLLYQSQISNTIQRPLFNPINIESKNQLSQNKLVDSLSNEQKNQILLIPNKNNVATPKMLFTIQQQSQQVLLQKNNIESKNLPAPSRLPVQTKKSKEEIINDNESSSNVVAFKRLHQENSDENDFENLITENQIYGNKIVVKEKSQGTSQEQDIRNKNKTVQNDTKNVVLQPNILYLSNVKFPANLMVIKDNSKTPAQINDTAKINKTNEGKSTDTDIELNNTESLSNTAVKDVKIQNTPGNKELHIVNSNNNVVHTLSNKNHKADFVFQATNQKVIMNPQIVYQVPMIIDPESNINQTSFINMDCPSFVNQNINFPKTYEKTKINDKLFIACPYQMDSKLQPKIVITNAQATLPQSEELSCLDMYEKRRRIRRQQKSYKELKEGKKTQDKTESRNIIITPETMTAEISMQLENTKFIPEDFVSDSESDYGDDEISEYTTILDESVDKIEDTEEKIEFMSALQLATPEIYKEQELVRMEKVLKHDAVARAYIDAGRLDLAFGDSLTNSHEPNNEPLSVSPTIPIDCYIKEQETGIIMKKKRTFFSQLKLHNVSKHYTKGYGTTWRKILKHRKEDRSESDNKDITSKQFDENVSGQLRILTEIKKSVNDNNNLIKMWLDSNNIEPDGDSIKELAEKSFSELSRLSIMADNSIKLFSGQDTQKTDVNINIYGDSVANLTYKFERPYTSLNIPNVTNRILMKTLDQEQNFASSTQMTHSCTNVVKQTENIKDDMSYQDETTACWSLGETIRRYKEFDAGRNKEIAELHKRTTELRVECAHVTFATSRESDKARALLTERQNLLAEENSLRQSIHNLYDAIDAIKKC